MGGRGGEERGSFSGCKFIAWTAWGIESFKTFGFTTTLALISGNQKSEFEKREENLTLIRNLIYTSKPLSFPYTHPRSNPFPLLSPPPPLSFHSHSLILTQIPQQPHPTSLPIRHPHPVRRLKRRNPQLTQKRPQHSPRQLCTRHGPHISALLARLHRLEQRL